MEDPVAAEFITLPDALHRLEGHVSEAHLQHATNDFADRLTAFEQMFGAIEGRNATAPSFIVASSDWPLTTAILRYSSKRGFAVEKLGLALQRGALVARVRNPQTGEWFRLGQVDWRFEPLQDEIIRGGIIPDSAARGFEPHRGRTVLLAGDVFEQWLTAETKTWPEASREELCYSWLSRAMLASPRDKQKRKAEWLEEAKQRFHVTTREFERAWSKAVTESGSNWDHPGAPIKPRKESPR
jgi:hypothetical protein